ncbi:hypothetical protein C8Q80DRAFT_118518 [Daedaleopsis nitida]|nr:hypothetical protein C8Q80DRAFT_118518 [Daedaleopsis nitida]
MATRASNLVAEVTHTAHTGLLKLNEELSRCAGLDIYTNSEMMIETITDQTTQSIDLLKHHFNMSSPIYRLPPEILSHGLRMSRQSIDPRAGLLGRLQMAGTCRFLSPARLRSACLSPMEPHCLSGYVALDRYRLHRQRKHPLRTSIAREVDDSSNLPSRRCRLVPQAKLNVLDRKARISHPQVGPTCRPQLPPRGYWCFQNALRRTLADRALVHMRLQTVSFRGYDGHLDDVDKSNAQAGCSSSRSLPVFVSRSPRMNTVVTNSSALLSSSNMFMSTSFWAS